MQKSSLVRIGVFLFLVFLFLVFCNIFGDTDRCGSYPYISGDTFRELADHILESNNLLSIKYFVGFDVLKVKNGDIIFVELTALDLFFKDYHNKIKSKYILITHNHDESAPGKFKKYLDDPNLVAWFTQNSNLDFHPKLIPIPIGIPNRTFYKLGHNDLKLTFFRNKFVSCEKENLVYLNFVIKNNSGERQIVYDLFKDLDFVKCQGKGRWEIYLQDLAKSKFALSPPGKGLDCHRTWEALYMNCFPIVKHSTLNKLYEDLPIIVINDWCEITKDFLEKKYIRFQNMHFNYEKLFFDYWKNLILEKQREARS